jgi:universal stress protein A
MQPITRILVPIDFSPQSKAALAHAITLAHQLDAELRLLHVYDFSIFSLADGTPMLDPRQFEEVADYMDRSLEEAKVEALAGGATVGRAQLLQGKPDVEILRVAQEDAIDLIVMGTHGRTGLRQVVMGSVAARVMRRASCPVFTVNTLPTRTRAEAAAVG